MERPRAEKLTNPPAVLVAPVAETGNLALAVAVVFMNPPPLDWAGAEQEKESPAPPEDCGDVSIAAEGWLA
jgi:hypothetical protein